MEALRAYSEDSLVVGLAGSDGIDVSPEWEGEGGEILVLSRELSEVSEGVSDDAETDRELVTGDDVISSVIVGGREEEREGLREMGSVVSGIDEEYNELRRRWRSLEFEGCWSLSKV